MALNRALESAPWKVGDTSAALMLDIAAGRPARMTRALSDDEMELAVRHGLTGLMAHQSDFILRAAATPIYARLAARHEVMRVHLRRVLPALHAAGIKATVVKGLHLAEWAYSNAGHRTTTDIDLVVPASQVDLAVEILSDDEAVIAIPPKTPKADKRNVPFSDPSGVRFTLDLHWDLFSYSQLRGCADGATDWAWDNATFVPDHDLGPMWVLPEAARIAFLCTHALLDHRFRLILFRDLAEVATTNPDWNALLDFVDRWQLRSTTYLALLIAVGIADADVPAESLDAMRLGLLSIPYLERALPKTDIVRFDGHSLHPLNLATVLVHDDRGERVRLALEAPLAFPNWRKRIAEEDDHHQVTPQTPAPKSMLLLVSSNRRRGAEVFGEHLAEGFRGHDWSVDFVALSGSEESAVVDAVPLTRRMPNGRIETGIVSALRSRIARRKPAVVFANGGSTLRYAALALAGVRNPPQLVYASIGEPAYWLRGQAHRVLQAGLHRRADLILAVSSETRRQLVELFRLDPDSVKVAHTGVPDSFLDILPKTPDGDFNIVFVGNLSAEKSPLLAIQALERLRAHVPARLRFVGSGPERKSLEAAAQNSGMGDSVEFTESVDDVRPHLEWADVLVLTSQTEGFPGVVLEAAATATPSVAFNVGGTAETIVDGATGIVIDQNDVAAFDAALLDLATDADRLATMGEAARRHVIESFSMRHSVDRFDELLCEHLGLPAAATDAQ